MSLAARYPDTLVLIASWAGLQLLIAFIAPCRVRVEVAVPFACIISSPTDAFGPTLRLLSLIRLTWADEYSLTPGFTT